MTYLRKHTIHFRGRNGRRGSVIVLVVAVLALLAVIGTVYIVSARSERAAASNGSVSENLDFAQQAVDKQFVEMIGNSVLDQFGDVGGRKTAAAGPGQFGRNFARLHDIAELNLTSENSSDGSHEQSWLVSNLYRNANYPFGWFPYIYNDYSMPISRTRVKDQDSNSVEDTPAVFNPATGQYDIALFQFQTSHTPAVKPVFAEATAASPSNGLFKVVSDTLVSGTEDGVVQLLPFSEANGTRYRFGLRIIDLSSMANLNAALPFNLATLNANQYFDQAEFYGTYANSYSLTCPSIFANGDSGAANAIYTNRNNNWSPSNLPGAPVPYAWAQATYRFEDPSLLSVTPYDLSDEIELRALGNFGTLAVPRPAAGNIWPNTLGNRPVGGGTVGGNPNRGFYTTYSYSRDLRPYADPRDPSTNVSNAYQLMSSDAMQWRSNVPPRAISNTRSYVWPPYPAKVNALPDISAYTPGASPPSDADYELMADTLAITATNLATAMRETGFGNNAQAYAANYLTSRWSGWVPMNPPPSGANVPVFYLKSGPSYLDKDGVHFRTVADSNGNNRLFYDYKTNDTLTSPDMGTKVFVGFAAQPFLNEVAIQSHKKDPIPPATEPEIIEDDAAIELYNPYNVAISLDDFQIIVNGTPIDFTGKNMWVPARGFFVMTNIAGKLDTAPTPIPDTDRVKKSDATTLGQPFHIKGVGTVILQRRYYEADLTKIHWATVDQFTTSGIADPKPEDSNPRYDFVARANNDHNSSNSLAGVITFPDLDTGRWTATLDSSNYYRPHKNGDADDDGNPLLLTLGTPNSSVGAMSPIVPLYDRTLELYGQDAYVSDSSGAKNNVRNFRRLIPRNIADFNRIMRISSEVDSTDGMPTVDGAVTSQLDVIVRGNSAGLAADAQVHFDFSDSNTAKLLDYITFTDRVSDYNINLGDNNSLIQPKLGGGAGPVVPFYSQGISKLRVPGKINVNTASPEVLSAIPVLYNTPDLISAILCYRWRTINDGTDLRIIPALRAGGSIHPYDFRGSGYGIRSLAELQIPISAYQTALGATPATINDRDQLWGQIFNSLTVRSDTFAVYAYLEAVRQNPRYSGVAFNNSGDWYTTLTTNGIGITDDPSDSQHALLRVSRRRWVSIVDRSFANYNRVLSSPDLPGRPSDLDPRFVQPTIVAQKDMPR